MSSFYLFLFSLLFFLFRLVQQILFDAFFSYFFCVGRIYFLISLFLVQPFDDMNKKCAREFAFSLGKNDRREKCTKISYTNWPPSTLGWFAFLVPSFLSDLLIRPIPPPPGLLPSTENDDISDYVEKGTSLVPFDGCQICNLKLFALNLIILVKLIWLTSPEYFERDRAALALYYIEIE